MDPVTQVVLAWALFGVTHIGLAVAPIRRPLVRRLGEPGFVVLYAVIASATLALLVRTYAVVRFQGPAGPELGAEPWARWPLVAASVLGVALMVGAFAPRGYWKSPMMTLVGRVREPWGLERITRHPFFSGLVLFMAAHALLSTRLVGAVFAGGFIAVSVLGCVHQARKLRARHGPDYQTFLDRTSAVPFAAIAAGRQRLVAGELPWIGLLLGVGAAIGLRAIHDSVFAYQGFGFTAAVVLLSAAIIVRSLMMRR